MQIIPLDPSPSQTLTAVLNNQECILHIYQRSTGLYLDLTISGVLVLAGVIGRDRTMMVRDAYIGLSGDLIWMDTPPGTSDPNYTGLGTRWSLVFLFPSETIPSSIIVPYWVPGIPGAPGGGGGPPITAPTGPTGVTIS